MSFKSLVRALSIVAIVTTPALTAVSASAQARPYAVLDRWPVGGEGGWDYVALDAPMHHLYVTHLTRVEVLDTETGKSVGVVRDLKRMHGVAFDSEGKYAYLSDGGANAVIVVDRKTYAKIKTIPTGTNPDGILFEPVTKTVWAFNGRSGDVTVIDTARMEVATTVKLPGTPEFPAADGRGNVFANIEDKGAMVKLDARTMKLVSQWSMAGCESPSGLAMDTEHDRLFSVCDGKKMAVTDAATGKQIALVAIGDGPDAAGFDAKDQIAFSSNGDGTLTMVSTKGSEYKVLQTLVTAKGARTMVFDPDKDRVYLLAAKLGAVPAATVASPRPRPAILPGTFGVIVVGRK